MSEIFSVLQAMDELDKTDDRFIEGYSSAISDGESTDDEDPSDPLIEL